LLLGVGQDRFVLSQGLLTADKTRSAGGRPMVSAQYKAGSGGNLLPIRSAGGRETKNLPRTDTLRERGSLGQAKLPLMSSVARRE
jgi:hypothetical protein